jgi:PAS domain S-box-containing protein
MNLDVKRPLPLYRKLLLENKILLFFAFLIGVLGIFVLAITYGAALLADVDRRAALRVVAVVAVAMAVPVVAVLLSARLAVRRAVQPLKELTRVADEISTGNLDPRIDFGVHVNCWEIKNCGRTDCKAYMNVTHQCWYLDGTPCEGFEPRFPQKMAQCRTCEVYQAHRGDEIVQLADAFRHMTNVLKDSRENLVDSDDFQKRLIRNSFDGIVATDEHGTVAIFNRLAEDLTGRSSDDVVGKATWHDFFDPGLRAAMDQPLTWEHRRRVRGFLPRESFVRRADGTRVDVRLSGISLYARGLHVGDVFFFQDLREVKRLREDLLRSERLAATGQAAAGISHSIRNILDGLRGGAYIFKQGQRRGDPAKMDGGFAMIERNVEIISNLVRDLLNFAKDRPPEYAPQEVRALLADVVAAIGLNGEGRVRVVLDVPDGTPAVVVDGHAFHQCLANLVRNAAEAIPEDRAGTITLAARVEGPAAVFSVADDGEGMTPETIEKVRRGMYSTKGSKGTGLGLQVVQKIVGEHRGELAIDSAPGKGATFRIAVPARGPEPRADGLPASPAPVS